MTLTAAQVLKVLNELDDVNLDQLELAVVVAGARKRFDTFSGRMVTVPKPHFWPFRPGELLILDKCGGREPFGSGRKPGKWDVRVECFDNLDAATARSLQVMAAEAQFTDDYDAAQADAPATADGAR